MEQSTIYILSVYLKKWSYGDNKLTFNYTFCVDDDYYRKHKEIRFSKLTNMVKELMDQIIKDTQNVTNNGNGEHAYQFYNDGDAKSKLNTFLTKISNEFRKNKKSNGKSRMISSRSIDFYYVDTDYEQISDDVKFYVHLNRGLNKVNGDLWSNAVTDFKQAISFRPEDVTANKHLAIAYEKLGQFSEAVPPLKIYVDSENTPEALNALAMAYVHLEEYNLADEILKKITDNFDDKSLALFSRAQIAYKKGNKYQVYLDKISKDDSSWLIDKLKTDWEYNLSDEEKLTVWNAATAARYLGFERPFDLTKKAFNQEIPSYFNADKGTIRFIKEEIDCWIELHNRYHLDEDTYVAYVDRLSEEEMNNSSANNR